MSAQQSSAEIEVSPDLPRIGHAVSLTVTLSGGRSISNNARVCWSFMARAGAEVSWPWGDAERLTVLIPKWTAQHQGTYHVHIEDADLKYDVARTLAPAIRIALSGGGYRASLFGMGALMYLVDVGANSRVEDIASVSGGSITNA